MQQLPVVLDLCLKNLVREIKIFFRPHEIEKPGFFNSSSLRSVFQKLRFRDGLVWTVGQSVEIKLSFQISPAHCARCLHFVRNFTHVVRERLLLIYKLELLKLDSLEKCLSNNKNTEHFATIPPLLFPGWQQ